MDYPFVKTIRTYIGYLIVGIFVSGTQYLSAINSDPVSKTEIDSLRKEISKCTSDTARFTILYGYFWSYANKDLDHVKDIGEWAFNEIKNSKNLKALSDGYDIKGFILQDEENLDSALFYFERALELSVRIGYKSRMAWSYFHLGEINYLDGNFSIALSYMKSAIKYFDELDYYNEAGTSMYYISDMYDRMGVSDSAISYNNKRMALFKSHSDTAGEIISNLAISIFYKNHNDSRKALDYLKAALVKAEGMNNTKTHSKVYFSIGDFFAEQKKNYSSANDYYKRVLEFAVKYHIRILEAQLLSQIGNIYLQEGKDSIALEYDLKSLAIAKEVKHRHTISNAYHSLGLVYKKRGDYNSALNCFDSCYSIGCNKCPAIVFHQTLIETGDTYFALNDQVQSLSWYRKSLDLAEKFHSLKDISLSTLRIANCYQKLKQYNTAEKYYLQSFKDAQGSGDLALIKSIADTMSTCFALRNNFSSAYKYKQLSTELGDSLNEINRQTDMTELEMKFEFEKIKKDNEAHQIVSQGEIKRQKILKNYFSVFSVLLIGFGVVVYVSYRRKKKDNKLLTYQKNQIEEKNEEIKTQVKEITSQKDEIERISGELHESDEMKLRFFSNISHEFRTPLTLILNPAENLLNTITGNGETKKQLECIYQNAQKLHDLTNQIMDLQKLDAGKLQLNPERADIVEYCLGIASSFESSCYKKKLSIRFSSNYTSVITFFDKDKIGKILINIMANALKFSYESSAIDVRIDIVENLFHLTITDSGIGISSEEINNVFKRYYQISAETQFTGTGIGLAYVKELVEFMNGKVSIKSVVKTGTKVIISIPVTECVVNDISEYRIKIPNTGWRPDKNEFDAAEFIKEDKNENTVLLVEDNDELRAFIADLLKTEFNVRVAKDGQEGLSTAFHQIPDIIISDVMMPGMNGFELCAILKKDERTSHIPVILLTARDSAQSSLEGYQAGADDYIIKPFDNEHLKLKVKNIIATREAARNQFDFKSILSSEGLNIGNTDKNFMRKCLAVIEMHIDNSSFSVDKLAEELAFSNRNFYRKIKALTNQTPAEFIRIYRLNFARQLLQNSKLKIFEISMAVGYEDINKFRQAFKKQFGVSPSECIKSLID
jgi:signal transduction histidine kinase/DNA-binding response OmpR family regulator